MKAWEGWVLLLVAMMAVTGFIVALLKRPFDDE